MTSRVRRESARAADDLFHSLAPKRRCHAPVTLDNGTPLIAPPGRFHLSARTLAGTVITITGLEATDTVAHVKTRIEAAHGFTTAQQCLAWRGYRLEDAMRLDDYGIESGATLILFLSLRGNVAHHPTPAFEFTLHWCGHALCLATRAAPTLHEVLAAARAEFTRLGVVAQPTWRNAVRGLRIVDGGTVLATPLSLGARLPSVFHAIEFLTT